MRIMSLALVAAVAAGFGLGAANRATAAMLGDATVPFTAQRTVTVDGHNYVGRSSASPDISGTSRICWACTRSSCSTPKRRAAISSCPALHTYVEFPFPALMAELDSPDLLSHPLGTETVAGIATTKYRVDHRARDGTRAAGFLWLSRSRLLMKLDVTVTRRHGGKKLTIAMQLSRVAVGPVDPALFVLPPGLAALPADALAPLLGGNPR